MVGEQLPNFFSNEQLLAEFSEIAREEGKTLDSLIHEGAALYVPEKRKGKRKHTIAGVPCCGPLAETGTGRVLAGRNSVIGPVASR